jgi:hypothetical protein
LDTEREEAPGLTDVSTVPRRRRAVLIGVSAALTIGLLLFLVVLPLAPTGLTVIGADMRADKGSRLVTQDYWIKNNGAVDERITAATTHAAGLAVLGSSIDRPITIRVGASTHVVMHYRITDCAAVPYGPLPVSLHLDRWWGTRTITVQDHGEDFEDAWVACGR